MVLMEQLSFAGRPSIKIVFKYTQYTIFFFYVSRKLLSRVTPVLHVGWDTRSRFTNIQVLSRAETHRTRNDVCDPTGAGAESLTPRGAVFILATLRGP